MQLWDSQLISQEEAYAIAGRVDVCWHLTDGGLILRHHGECGQSCGLWHPRQPTTADDVLAAVLRHLVVAHDMPLNRAARERMNLERDDDGRPPGGPARARPGAAGAPAAGPGPGAAGPAAGPAVGSGGGTCDDAGDGR